MLEAHTEELGEGIALLENGGVGQQLRQANTILGSMLTRLQGANVLANVPNDPD